jgi:hypothetical protein
VTAEAVDIAEDKHGTILFGQPLDGELESLVQLPAKGNGIEIFLFAASMHYGVIYLWGVLLN